MGIQFKPELIEKILAGHKTQTRRKCELGDYAGFGRVCNVDGRPKWIEGHTYTIQPGRGKHGVGRIKVTRCLWERHLQNIDLDDARAEGFDNVRDFAAYWDYLYADTQYAWENNPEVWVLEFELVKRESD